MKENTGHPTGTERLARLLIEQNGIPLTEAQLRAARLCVLDAVGAGLYGSTQPEAEQLLQAAEPLGRGNVVVWGTGMRAEAGTAALLTGTFCHLRELDDVHYAILHTGSVCVPAAIAVAQVENATLGEILRAVISGTEAMVRVSLGMDYMDHRERGWHGTATCGAFGSAAAAGTILGLNENQMADALGIAGSRTGGTWAFSMDGAMTKRLHPGLAARDGLLAAYLAQSGVTGPRYVLESEDGGFYRVFSGTWDLNALTAPGNRLEIENVEYKWFASCKSVHSPISAAIRIHEEQPERGAQEVERVNVEVNRSALSMAGHSYEEDSVVSAQISIPYGVALGLLGRSGQAEDYSLTALKDPEIRRIADRVDVQESEEFNELRRTRHISGARVTVYWTDGTSSEAVIHHPKGSIADPLKEEDVVQKYASLARNALGTERTGQLQQLILEGAEDTPVSRLKELLVPQDRNAN